MDPETGPCGYPNRYFCGTVHTLCGITDRCAFARTTPNDDGFRKNRTFRRSHGRPTRNAPAGVASVPAPGSRSRARSAKHREPRCLRELTPTSSEASARRAPSAHRLGRVLPRTRHVHANGVDPKRARRKTRAEIPRARSFHRIVSTTRAITDEGRRTFRGFRRGRELDRLQRPARRDPSSWHSATLAGRVARTFAMPGLRIPDVDVDAERPVV